MVQHDDVLAEDRSQIVKQLSAIHRFGPRLNFFERDYAALETVVPAIEAEISALDVNHTIENRVTHTEFLGGGLACPLVLDQWKFGETFEFSVVGTAILPLPLLIVAFLIIRCCLD